MRKYFGTKPETENGARIPKTKPEKAAGWTADSYVWCPPENHEKPKLIRMGRKTPLWFHRAWESAMRRFVKREEPGARILTPDPETLKRFRLEMPECLDALLTGNESMPFRPDETNARILITECLPEDVIRWIEWHFANERPKDAWFAHRLMVMHREAILAEWESEWEDAEKIASRTKDFDAWCSLIHPVTGEPFQTLFKNEEERKRALDVYQAVTGGAAS